MSLELPDLPEPPRELERAMTCAGWTAVERGDRPTCERCVARLAELRHVAAGHGTPAEIRAAIAEIQHAGVPHGQTVRLAYEGLSIWACPRAIKIEGTPLLEIAVNRRERRRRRLNRAAT